MPHSLTHSLTRAATPSVVSFGFSTAAESNKQNKDEVAFLDYNRSMHRNSERKAQFFADRLIDPHTDEVTLQTEKPYVVVDLGCNTGSLLEKLHLIMASMKPVEYMFKFIGVDLNQDMLRLAKQRLGKYNETDPENINLQAYSASKLEKMKSNPFLQKASVNWRFSGSPWEKWSKNHLYNGNLDTLGRFTIIHGDITETNYGRNTIDAFLMSSVLHEIYSYGGENGYSYDEVYSALQNLFDSLEHGGRVIIRDPARPENPGEYLLVTPNEEDGQNPNSLNELLSTDPHLLSTRSLLDRFLVQFKPANGQFEIIDGKYQLPAWLISEFIRHRVVRKSATEWNAEMKEQYGVFTEAELRKTADLIGFNPIEVRSVFNPDSTAVGIEEELQISDLEGNVICQSERFPTHLYAVLEKPKQVLS
ncbi:MAG: hypothetical protein AB7P76_03125 [Candidatus Melainabacteria bacterium]